MPRLSDEGAPLIHIQACTIKGWTLIAAGCKIDGQVAVKIWELGTLEASLLLTLPSQYRCSLIDTSPRNLHPRRPFLIRLHLRDLET